MNRGVSGLEEVGYIFFICFFLFGLFGLINKLFYLKRVVKGKGVILEIYSAGSGEDSGLNANVEFKYKDGLVIFETSIPKDTFIKGDSIAVMFDPKNPNDAAYDSIKRFLIMEFGFCFIGGLGIYLYPEIGIEIWNRYADYFGLLISKD